MPATRATRRNQAIAPNPLEGTNVSSDVVAARPSAKGRRVQPTPAVLEDGAGMRSRAPSPPTPDRVLAVPVAHPAEHNDSGEDEWTNPGTTRPNSQGSSRVASSAGSCTPQKRKRDIEDEHTPTPKVRVVKVESPSTLQLELPTTSQPTLDQKNKEIKSLKDELESLRRAFNDLQLAKTTLAKEVHRLHQLSTEDSETFARMNVANGKGDSKGWQRKLKRDGLGDIPTLLPLPAKYEGGQVIDIPPVMVIGDCIEVNGLTIRFEEPIGAGMSGKVIGGYILNGGTKGDEIVPVAIKATMKSGFAPFDKELFREARALHSLGKCGVAPKLLTVIETPLRFLTIMERYPMCLWNLDTYIRDKSSNSDCCLSMDVVQILAKKLTVLLSKLHCTNQVHRDLKPENVLINKEGEMVLADFGSLGVVGEKYDGGNFGTEGFVAPYANIGSRKQKNSTDMDMYSLGATILWLAGADLKDKSPVSGEECQKLIEKQLPKAKHPQAHAFVSRCLAFPGSGRKRLTAHTALNHPWLKKVAPAEIEENLSLCIRKAAASTEKSLREDPVQYYLNIGVGACRQLDILD